MTNNTLAHTLQWGLPEGWESQLPNQVLDTDEARMEFVVRLARWNISGGTGGPFGAAVFERGSGELISVGVNRVVDLSCSIAHGEALAIALAQKRLGTHDLSQTTNGGCELVTSGQPCIQCFGMVWWSGLSRLVIGARAEDIEELCGFDEGPIPENWKSALEERRRLPLIEVVTDVCRDEARDLLREYTAISGTNYGPGSACSTCDQNSA